MTDKEKDEKFINELLSDKAKFDAYLYTDWRTAVQELEQRRTDVSLEGKVRSALAGEPPEVMGDTACLVFFRHVATPNFETHRFAMCADVVQKFKPLIFEFIEDKFTDLNPLKKSLGKLPLYKKLNKNLEPIIEYHTIIEMSKCNGKPISSIETHNGQSLVDLHRSLFRNRFPHLAESIVDLSEWLMNINGKKEASAWYKHFLLLFIYNGILFENFLTTDTDINLTKNVVLPAFIEIERELGYKPLIVALEPTHIEGDSFWNSYPHTLKSQF